MTARTGKELDARVRARLLLTALVLPPSLHVSTAPVSIQQMDSGAQSDHQCRPGRGEEHPCRARFLNFAGWLNLNSHPDINSSDFSLAPGRRRWARTSPSTLYKQARQRGCATGSWHGRCPSRGKPNLSPEHGRKWQQSRSNPYGARSQTSRWISPYGDSNLVRLRPENGGTLMLDVEGSGNEFVLKQNAGSVDPLSTYRPLGTDTRATRQDGTNSPLI